MRHALAVACLAATALGLVGCSSSGSSSGSSGSDKPTTFTTGDPAAAAPSEASSATDGIGSTRADGVKWAVSYLDSHCETSAKCGQASLHAQSQLEKKYGKKAGGDIFEEALPKVSMNSKLNLVGAMQDASDALAECEKKHPDVMSKAYNDCVDKIP